METGGCQQPSRAGDNTRGNVYSSVNMRSGPGRIPRVHTSLINKRLFSWLPYHLCKNNMEDLKEKKIRKCSCLTTSSQDEKCGRDLLILQRGNPRAELEWFAMQRLQICRKKLWSNKYRRFRGRQCFDYLQITTGLTLCQCVCTVIQPLFWLWALFLTQWIQKQSSQNRNGCTVNNTTYIQEHYKDGGWWFSQLSVWTHKIQPSLTQKGGVYDSLQSLQAKSG